MVGSKKRVHHFLRRLGALLLSCSMLALPLAGCSSAKNHGLDPKKPTSVTVWHYYNGVQKQIFDEMVTRFNETVGAEQGVVVEAYSHSNVNELKGKVMDAIDKKVGADSVPDMFAAYADTAYTINERGMAADISQYLTQEEQDSYLAAYLDEGRFDSDGSLKLLPMAKSTEVFMLNKTDWDKFAAATGASEDSFKTWEGIAQVAKEYYQWTDSQTPAPDDGKAFYGRDAMANYPIIGSVQLGKELFHVEAGKVTYQVDREIMKRIWDCYYVPYISGYFGAYGRFRSDDAKTGSVIALVGSTSGAAYFPTAVTNEDGSTYPIQAVTYPLPNFEGKEPVAVQQGAGMVVTKGSETTEYAAVQFLKWFTQPEQNVQFCISSGYLPVKIEANSSEVIDAALAADSDGSPVLRQTIQVGAEMVRTYQMYTNKAFSTGTQARDVVDTALQAKADADRAKVLELMAAGTPHDEAVAQLATDANFESWLTEFQSALEALQ